MKILILIALSLLSVTACAEPIDACAQSENILWKGLHSYEGPSGEKERIADVIQNGDAALGTDNALTVAVWFGYDDVIEKLLKDPNILDKYGAESLYLAASMGRLKEISILLNAGVPPDSRIENGYTSMYGATQYGCIQSAQLLISSGANVNLRANDQWPLLKFAIVSEQLDAARFLVAHGYIADDGQKKEIQKILHRMGMDSKYSFIFGDERASVIK